MHWLGLRLSASSFPKFVAARSPKRANKTEMATPRKPYVYFWELTPARHSYDVLQRKLGLSPTRGRAKIFPMKIQAIIHTSEEGGFWAEVPALPGCVTQGDSRVELESNLREAVEGWLLAGETDLSSAHEVLEMAI